MVTVTVVVEEEDMVVHAEADTVKVVVVSFL